MPFGHCEFETVEGVLRSIRLLNGLKLVDKELQIKPSEKTEMFIKEWKELRKREWEMNHREEGGTERSRVVLRQQRGYGGGQLGTGQQGVKQAYREFAAAAANGRGTSLTVRCCRRAQGEISGRNSRGLSYRCSTLPGCSREQGNEVGPAHQAGLSGNAETAS